MGFLKYENAVLYGETGKLSKNHRDEKFFMGRTQAS